MESESESPRLSAHSLAALTAFLQEKNLEDAPSGDVSEQWGLSQFWYTEDTAREVAAVVVKCAGERGRIACIACPSLFRYLVKNNPQTGCHLFEYDRRFEVLGHFSRYDYRQPEDVDAGLRHTFDVIVADPPYLSEECLAKTVETMKLLARSRQDTVHMLLTGASMCATAQQLLGLRPVRFRPEHRNKLGNEFYLYTSSEPAASRLGGWDADAPD